MGFDCPFMPISSFAPAIEDVQRWEDFTDEDLSLLAHKNAALLYRRRLYQCCLSCSIECPLKESDDTLDVFASVLYDAVDMRHAG